MKKMFFFIAIALVFNACHKKAQLDTVHELIKDLPSDTKLPSMDTTSAFSYIVGTIGDLPFSLVSGKDSVEFSDYASESFYTPYDSTMVQYGASGWWILTETEKRSKYWTFHFTLPSLPVGLSLLTGAIAYKKRKIDLTTPQTFTNIGYSGVSLAGDSTKGNQFGFQINRTDNYNGKSETRGFATWFIDQTRSYIKLISVRNYRSPLNLSYSYELMYEFDVMVQGNPDNPPVHMKGKAKFWITTLKL